MEKKWEKSPSTRAPLADVWCFPFQVKEPSELWNKKFRWAHRQSPSRSTCFGNQFSATQKRVNKNKAAHIGIYEPWRHPRMITLSTLISFFSPYISLWLRCRAHKYKHLNIPPCALAERAANIFNEGTARNMNWNSSLKKYSTRLLFVPFLVGCEQKSEIFLRVPGFTCEFRWNLLRKEVEVIVQVLI